MRGNLSAGNATQAWIGSIPACAGEPIQRLDHAASIPVYPRVCGGTKPLGSITLKSQGLSPRVRGNLLLAAPDVARSRSIPACAGEPDHTDLYVDLFPVYPRVCGGTNKRRYVAMWCGGLSPRVRGNRLTAGPSYSWHRSIPACAGEPPSTLEGPRSSRVYPRVCGEPCRHLPPRNSSTVYPRVCGGTVETTWKALTTRGLSPRVRGNRIGYMLRVLPTGSIPACAGEPAPASPDASTARLRSIPACAGEPSAWPALQALSARCGLSPRVRGNQVSRMFFKLTLGQRSIPACAGEPGHRAGSSADGDSRSIPACAGEPLL